MPSKCTKLSLLKPTAKPFTSKYRTPSDKRNGTSKKVQLFMVNPNAEIFKSTLLNSELNNTNMESRDVSAGTLNISDTMAQ